MIGLVLVEGQLGENALCAAEPPHQGVPVPRAPQTLPEIGSEILQSREMMASLIAAKKLTSVEDPAFRIASLAAKLPSLSSILPPEKISALKQLIQKVQRLTADLDNTGDSNNLSGTQANAKKLDEVLQLIAGLYPAGILPDKPAPASGAMTSSSPQSNKP